MNEKHLIGVGYEFDYANEPKATATAWNDNINRRGSLYGLLVAAERRNLAAQYRRGWRMANVFRKAHGKRRRPLK